ncbi:MAG: hypothetical protein II786_04770 [Muribaculaceae bacterium]|nr:hypothetical protein [Muribaculaceae bacterium]MBR3100163.1 hypothetical protein [Muribaculaceae bacterium]
MKPHISLLLIIASVGLLCCGCDKVNNKEVPAYYVRLDLSGYGLWNVYGVSGVGDYRFFDRAKGIPSNFPYNVNTYTGFGGILLMIGLDISTGNYGPVAYDAACPVESQQSVTVGIDNENLNAVCPKCGSRYDVLQGSGTYISGPAATNRLGLRIYRVTPNNGGYVITH